MLIEENHELPLNGMTVASDGSSTINPIFSYSDEELDDVTNFVIHTPPDPDIAVISLTENGVQSQLQSGDTFTQTQFANGSVTISAINSNLNSLETTSVTLNAQANGGAIESNPITIVIDVFPSDDTPVVEVTPPLGGFVAPENTITELTPELFNVTDEEGFDMLFFQVTDITYAGTSTPIPNVFFHNSTNNNPTPNPLLPSHDFTSQDLINESVAIHTTNAFFAEETTMEVTFIAQPDTGAGPTNEFTLTVILRPGNDVATLALNTSTVQITEGDIQPTVLNPSIFSFSDDENNRPDSFMVDPFTLPTGVTFEANGTPLTNTFTYDQLTSGQISINALNAEITDSSAISTPITLQAVNLLPNGNNLISNSVTLEIVINPTNDAPILEFNGGVIVNEGSFIELNPSQFSFSDEEGKERGKCWLISYL